MYLHFQIHWDPSFAKETEVVQGAVEAAFVAGFAASNKVEDAGAVGEMAVGGAEVVDRAVVEAKK